MSSFWEKGFSVKAVFRVTPNADQKHGRGSLCISMCMRCVVCCLFCRADVMELPGGRSKGMGTVLFADPEGARAAIDTFNNYSLHGRQILVRYDRKEQL